MIEYLNGWMIRARSALKSSWLSFTQIWQR